METNFDVIDDELNEDFEETFRVKEKERNKARKRRNNTKRIKLSRMKRASSKDYEGIEGYSVVKYRLECHKEKVLIPERTYQAYTIKRDKFGSPYLIKVDRCVPEHYEVVKKRVYVPTTPHLRRFSISGRRKFAKDCTDSKVRMINKSTCQKALMVNSEQLDDIVDLGNNGHKKVYDYAYTIW